MEQQGEQSIYTLPPSSGQWQSRGCHRGDLTNKEGKGIRVTAIDRPFSFSALHYTVDDIYKTTHDCDLKPRKEVILSLDAAVLGLGNSSCGPGVLKKYAIDKQKPHTLRVRFSLIK